MTRSYSGVGWAITSAPHNFWSSVASSEDGAKLVAASGGYADGLIYTSTNFGATWAPTSAPSNYWSSVTSSADGTKLVAAGGLGKSPYGGDSIPSSPIYTSTNSGATWTPTTAPTSYWAS